MSRNIGALHASPLHSLDTSRPSMVSGSFSSVDTATLIMVPDASSVTVSVPRLRLHSNSDPEDEGDVQPSELVSVLCPGDAACAAAKGLRRAYSRPSGLSAVMILRRGSQL